MRTLVLVGGILFFLLTSTAVEATISFPVPTGVPGYHSNVHFNQEIRFGHATGYERYPSWWFASPQHNQDIWPAQLYGGGYGYTYGQGRGFDPHRARFAAFNQPRTWSPYTNWRFTPPWKRAQYDYHNHYVG